MVCRVFSGALVWWVGPLSHATQGDLDPPSPGPTHETIQPVWAPFGPPPAIGLRGGARGGLLGQGVEDHRSLEEMGRDSPQEPTGAHIP